MNFKNLIVICALLISSTWAFNSNDDDDPRNTDEINPENDNTM